MSIDAALAKLARYEAPGPALLVERHVDGCGDSALGLCACGAQRDNLCHREQHARCVAVVERLLVPRVAEIDALLRAYTSTREHAARLDEAYIRLAVDVRACIAALKDGAK